MSVYPPGNPDQQERERLLAAINLAPDDPNLVFQLAQRCFEADDFAAARDWFTRRAEMGGWDEEIFIALLRIAQSMHRMDEPWPEIQDAYLRAWEFRPSRAEPLYLIAYYYRWLADYQLGYLFAERAANIPEPADSLYVTTSVYEWRALDEQGICASWIGKKPESYRLFRRILARDDIDHKDRERLIGYCEYLAPVMVEEATGYPEHLVQSLTAQVQGLTAHQSSSPTGTVTVAITGTRGTAAIEQTLNSFLNCCSDIDKVRRFVLIPGQLDLRERTALLDRYPFLEISDQIADERYVLSLVADNVFVDREPIIGRLIAVLDHEPDIARVAIGLSQVPTRGRPHPQPPEFRISGAGDRYVLRSEPAIGHVLVDATRENPNAQPMVATLDEMLCFAQSTTKSTVPNG
jgi:hypothetical protein